MFKQENAHPDFEKTATFRGLRVESTHITRASEYSFKWEGSSHYLAIHDIVMIDGEMTIGSGPIHPAGGIRGKMTDVPPLNPISGWTKN